MGAGAPILLLTGGPHRDALNFAFMERLAKCYLIIAPDYTSVQKIDQYITAFDTILRIESIDTFALGGQSYDGLRAQASQTYRTKTINRLILSSTGPADYCIS